MKMTSAYANKLIRKLQEDKVYWREIEQSRHKYIVAQGEEPIIPEYDFSEVNGTIGAIDAKIVKIKHALNVSNATNTVDVDGERYSIDMLLVKMAQLNERKKVLDSFRKLIPKARVVETGLLRKTASNDIQCINFDMDAVKEEYARVEKTVNSMIMALDVYNQTVGFEVDI